ncbi:MAG: TetR/AcrR family transcriptional regulator [Deltaproteobacteria bacterium]|nr:TetR/AcrR family transcriptional regulator [Deltaproteobacteria bacterium]
MSLSTPRTSAAAQEKRGRILDAALERFAHYGYRRTSMEDIAEVAGISRAALYLHFKNKEEIFRALGRALHERAIRDAAAAARQAGSVATRLQRALEAKLGAFFQIVHGNAHARELLDENSRICGDISEEFRQRHLAILRRIIEGASKSGGLTPGRAGLTAATAAEMLLDAAKGIETGGATVLTPASYQRRLGQLVAVLVLGLGGAVPHAPRKAQRR